MAQSGTQLSPKQHAAALLLASGSSVRDAATKSRAGLRTLRRWQTQATFRRHVSEVRAELMNRAFGRLVDGLDDATATLRQLLSAESQSVRLGACRTILEFGVKLRESIELEGRVAAIEERLDSRPPAGGAS